MKSVISAFVRTPFHFARKGALAHIRPDVQAAEVIKAALQRTSVGPESIDDVIAGCAYPEGAQGNNIARIAALLAGMPFSVTGMTINRFCGSSMSAIHVAAAQIEAGLGQAYLCVGVESMSMVPQGGLTFSPHPELLERTDTYISMGDTAENVASRYRISRSDQEIFALQSHHKAAAAQRAGYFDAELVPLALPDGQLLATDGCIRPNTSLEALAGLKPAFRSDGVVTAGTSSPLTDGASAVLVTSDAYAERHRLAPLARIRAMAVAGIDPAYMRLDRFRRRAGRSSGRTSGWKTSMSSKSMRRLRPRLWRVFGSSDYPRTPSIWTVADSLLATLWELRELALRERPPACYSGPGESSPLLPNALEVGRALRRSSKLSDWWRDGHGRGRA